MEDLSTYTDEQLAGLVRRGQYDGPSSWSACPQGCGGGGRGGRVCHHCAEKELINRHGEHDKTKNKEAVS
jgi:hypothetical protein